MRQVSVEEASKQFLKLIEAAVKGEEIIITKSGQPIIKFVTIDAPKPKPHFGSAKHLNIKLSDDFDAPLEDFAEYMR